MNLQPRGHLRRKRSKAG
ncbi:hypothetical protein YPPY94_2814, partial [Yersinia pestis PY-94]